MNIEKLWAMILVTSAFGAVVARDIPPGPDLEVDDIMITEEENFMDYWNYTAKLNTDIVRSHGVENLQCQWNGQYLPHPTCCSMFVQCSWSTPIEQACAPGTAWSQSANTCVHISTTNCGKIAPVTPYPLAACSCGMANTNNRIIGGADVYPELKYPWQVGLRVPIPLKYISCGGSIINTKYVLTAAHCVYNYNPSQKLHVHIGEHDQTSTSEDGVGNNTLIPVKDVIIHPCYNRKTEEYDFALVELEDTIVFDDFIKPVCLPDDDSETYAGKNATVTGWGDTAYNPNSGNANSSPKLQELDVTILNNNNCAFLWENATEITTNQLCASEPNTWAKNVCHGDSGGPLVVKNQKSRYVQVGVASFIAENEDDLTGQITGCNVPDSPGVYSRVSKVLDWIKAESADGQYCDN